MLLRLPCALPGCLPSLARVCALQPPSLRQRAPTAAALVAQVGAERSFDPTLYSAAISANRAQQAESTLRSFVGSGSILEWGSR